MDESYWFSAQELVCICDHVGTPVQIYEHHRSDDGDAHFVPLATHSTMQLAGIKNVVRVVLVTNRSTGCGHFSRLFTSAEWQEIWAADNDNASQSTGSGASSSTASSYPAAEKSDSTFPPATKTSGNENVDEELSEIDSLSEESDGFDPDDARVDPDKVFTTREDLDLAIVANLKQYLRAHPLMPCDPLDHTVGYLRPQTGIRLPLLHCAFRGCTWTKDYRDVYIPDNFGQWSLEWCLFEHLMEKHRDAFGDILDTWFDSNDDAKDLLSVVPFQCKETQKHNINKRQDELFLKVYSFYMAAVSEKEREGMPVIGLAKDRQVLRPLNNIMSTANSKICFGCAQIHAMTSLWSYMYKPGKWGMHFDVGTKTNWSEHFYSSCSSNQISMYAVRDSLHRMLYRDERNFRLHFSMHDFKERYCSDSQPDGNPFRNSKLFEADVQDWMQDLQTEDSSKVAESMYVNM